MYANRNDWTAFGLASDLDSYAFNPDKAKQLLKDGGWDANRVVDVKWDGPATGVDELRGDVERHRYPVPFEDGERDVGEVGGAVVEGDRDEWLGHGGGGGDALEPIGEADGPVGGG